jgi:hypothetical protein
LDKTITELTELVSPGANNVLLIVDLATNTTKKVAWENKVPFPIRYCISCRKLIVTNHRDFVYCESCDKDKRSVEKKKSDMVRKNVENSLSFLKVGEPDRKVPSKLPEIKKPDVYGRYEGNTLHINIKK